MMLVRVDVLRCREGEGPETAVISAVAAVDPSAAAAAARSTPAAGNQTGTDVAARSCRATRHEIYTHQQQKEENVCCENLKVCQPEQQKAWI